MNSRNGFSLIEVLLAIGIISGTILCLLGLFTPIFAKAKIIGDREEVVDIADKIYGFIQSRSFNEIFLATKEKQSFYFYKGADQRQEVAMSIDSIRQKLGSTSIIRATLFPSLLKDISSFLPDNYPESYFGVYVEICILGNIDISEQNQRRILTFTTIKNI